MRLTLAEPRYLKESISIISDLVNESKLKVSKQSIKMVAMDPANVAMVVFELFSSSFTEYDLKKDEEIKINLNSLKQIMRRAKPDDMLTLELDAENRFILQLKSNTVRTFNLPQIELDEKEQKVPDLKFPVSIKLPSGILNDAIEDVDVVAESVTFMAEPKKFTIHAEGDLSQAKIEIKEDGNTKIKVDGDEKIKAKYSIEYLKKMIAGSKIADEVSIYFNKDYPLKLEYKTIDKVMLSFILAPRVENE